MRKLRRMVLASFIANAIIPLALAKSVTKGDLEAARAGVKLSKQFKDYVKEIEKKIGKPALLENGSAKWWGADGKTCYKMIAYQAPEGNVSNVNIQEEAFNPEKCQ